MALVVVAGASEDEAQREAELDARGGGVSLIDWHAAGLEDRRVRVRRVLKNILIVFCGLVSRRVQHAMPIIVSATRTRHREWAVEGRERYTKYT